MSAFYIGQRVKKVRGKHNVGLTGTVAGFAFNDESHTLIVSVDAPYHSVDGTVEPAGEALWQPGYWEPILPEGLESLKEINALYEPQGVSA